MMTVSACLWLGLFPLLHLGSYAHITADKWTIMLVLSAATVLMAVFDALLARRRALPARRNSPSFVAALLLAAALLVCIFISCLLSPYSLDECLIGLSRRREGLLSQLCYLGLFFLFATGRVRREPVLCAASAGVIAFLVVVLLQRGGVNALGLYPRGRSYATNPDFQGTIGNLDMDSGYLVLAGGLLWAEIVRLLRTWIAEKRKPRLPEACMLAVTAAGFGAAAYLVFTMGVQFGVIALAALLVFSLLFLLPRKWFFILLVLLLVIALAAVWFWPGHGGGLWELHEIMHGRTQMSFGSNRVAVWTYSVQMAGESRLWEGGGPDTFEPRFNAYLQDHGLVIPTAQDGVPLPDYFDMPHNEYIGQLVNHGLPAAVLFLLLLLLLAFPRRFGRGLSSWNAAVLCYAVQAFFSFSVCLVAPMFWVAAGISAAEKGRSGDEKTPQKKPGSPAGHGR